MASASSLRAESPLIASDTAANDLTPSVPSGRRNNGQSASDKDMRSSPIDLMVHTRARRSNAGNRMSQLIAIEEADDIGRSLYEALEDVPDDDDFSNSETAVDADDISLGSSGSEDSSDNDRHIPGSGELKGEKDLEKEERNARRAMKRKAHDAFLKRPGLLKRARLRDFYVKEPVSASVLTPTSTQLLATPVEQIRRRKSERVSWLGAEGSLDSSSRRLSSRSSTLKSRAETHQRLLSKERTRLITVATMKAAEERREALKQKPLTQRDRLADAARTERLNAKSLNRWEEAERKKAAERRAKLEAQRNRGIEGEFIRFWSGSLGAKLIKGRPSEATSSHIILPSEVASSTKTSENSEAQGSLPLLTRQHTGNSDGQLRSGSIVGQPSLVIDPKFTASFDDRGGKISPLTLTSEDISPQPMRPSLTNSTQAPTVPMRSSLTTPRETYSTSQSPEVEKIEENLEGREPSSAFPEGIHCGTALPKITQQAVISEAITSMKSASQPNLRADALSSSITSLTNITTQARIPCSPRNGDTIAPIHVADTYSSQLITKEAALPDLYKQRPALPQKLSPFEEQPKQRRPSHRHLPYPPPDISRSASSEKQAYNLIILKNIDAVPTQSSNSRDRDREKDSLQCKLFGWPTSFTATTGVGALGAMAFKRKQYYNHLHYPTLCAISGQRARYRDPATALPYRSAQAFRCIRRAVNGACRWSELLESFLGPENDGRVVNENCASISTGSGVSSGLAMGLSRPAAGVPERFWGRITRKIT